MHIALSPASKDFLSVLDLSIAALDRLLDRAAALKASRGQPVASGDTLNGRHVAMLFQKPSLRTRSTFEVAIHELEGHALYLPSEFADSEREPIEDVARNLDRWVHGLVVRTFEQEKVERFAAFAPRLHVINALTDAQHPCQALADALTMTERWGTCAGRTLAYVGDGNNVAVSLAHVSAMLGMTLRIASPPEYALSSAVAAEARAAGRPDADIQLLTDPFEAVSGADAVYTDVWASMGQEDEASARRQVFMPFQVNASLMAAAGPDAIFMHCLPAHRGEEVTAEVMESPASIVFDQAENRLHTQKALLLHLLT